MPEYPIPFNRPGLTGQEFEYMARTIQDGHISGDGSFTKRCEQLLQETVGVPRVLLTTSCTHALEMAALLLDLKPGDEVIVPSFTFVSTVNAFALRGVRPVFADVRMDTLNMDEGHMTRLLTDKTRAIVAVHYGGIGCEVDALGELADARGVTLIEDNAHGLFGKYRGRWLGSLGALATQSFHETKNFYCGEGGALLVNDARFVERAEILREKGTNRSRFFRGQVDKYTWVDLGSSYVPSDLLAAFLFAQLEARERIQSKRKKVWDAYQRELAPIAVERGWRLPQIPSHCEQSYHLYYMLLSSEKERAALIRHLKERGILAVFHYQPLHLSDMGRRYGGKPGDCPTTEDVADRLLRLPFYNDLTETDQTRVVEALREFRG